MNCTHQNSSDQNAELQKAKESKTITQSRNKRGCLYQQDVETVSLAELIRQSQNGDTDASLTLVRMFEPLLEREAGLFVRHNLFTEKEDAKSQAVLFFFEFISDFYDFTADSNRIAGLIKKYLHDSRIDFGKTAARHCPDCYTMDFEKELEENSPFSQRFPICEMQADRKLERKFLRKVLQESMRILSPKEKTVVEKIIIENKPPSSVAKDLHCSTRYLRRLKQRALARIRQYLEAHYPSLQVL